MFSLTRQNENFRDAFLFKNKALTIGLRNNRVLSELDFNAAFFTTYGNKIKNLVVRDIFLDDNYVGLQNFRINTGMPVSLFQYHMLKGMVEAALVRYRKPTLAERTTADVATFVNRSKKGSRRFRKVLTVKVTDYVPHNIVKFRDNVDVVVGLDCAKKLNSIWNASVFSNSTRTFLFKLYNNTLGYNSAVAHFVRNHSPNCTFCDIERIPEAFNETPLHLFFNCATVEPFIENMFKWFVDDETFEFSRTEFFTTFDRVELSASKNYMLTVFSKLTQKFVWDSKQRHAIPCLVHCKVYIGTEITSMSETSRNFRKIFQESGYGGNFVL
jgi:hypothetical protein